MSDVLPAIPARHHQPHPIEVRYLSPPQLEDNLPVLATSQGCTVHFLAWQGAVSSFCSPTDIWMIIHKAQRRNKCSPTNLEGPSGPFYILSSIFLILMYLPDLPSTFDFLQKSYQTQYFKSSNLNAFEKLFYF